MEGLELHLWLVVVWRLHCWVGPRIMSKLVIWALYTLRFSHDVILRPTPASSGVPVALQIQNEISCTHVQVLCGDVGRGMLHCMRGCVPSVCNKDRAVSCVLSMAITGLELQEVSIQSFLHCHPVMLVWGQQNARNVARCLKIRC